MPDAPGEVIPLVVLSSHRSGSSAFMSLLAAAGLELGELLPPAPDNPRGFFESRPFVDANRRLLGDADRDWTCPPRIMNHRLLDLEALGKAVEPLAAGTDPWGLKDPRALFTLPAWAPVLGPIHLVGIHRSTAAIARSLSARNEFTEDDAQRIAAAYSERLADVHRELRFPIISFDDPDTFVERSKQVAELMGLQLTDDLAEATFDGDLIHHQSDADYGSDVDRHLAAAAHHPIESLPAYTPATIVRIWERCPQRSLAELRTDVGPNQDSLRSQLFDLALSVRQQVGEVAAVESGPREPWLARHAVKRINLSDEPGAGASDHAFSHIVAPQLLDETPPEAISSLLESIAARLEPGGVAVLSGWMDTGDRIAESRWFERADTTAYRSRPPYLHHLDQIVLAAMSSPLHAARTALRPSGRRSLVLSLDPRAIVDEITPSALRDRLGQAEERLDRTTTRAEEAEAELAGLRPALARLEQAHAEDRPRLAQMQKDLESTKRQRDELQRSVDTLHARTRRAESKLATAERRLVRANRSYDRLRNRRIVRLSLSLAALARPLFRLVRRRHRPTDAPQEDAAKRTMQPVATAPPSPGRSRSEVVQAVRSLRPLDRYPTSGPRVSIIILTRNGADHLATLMPRLEATAYSDFEVIVVDNGSSDGTGELLARPWSLELRVIQNEHNRSFSEGNNQAVEQASGELLVFLNNDLEPITDGWLAAMVSAACAEPRPAAVGAMLVYPDRGDPGTDLTVQHTGIGFGFRRGAPHATNLGAIDPADGALGGTREVPAATAAALLVSRDTFDQVGGFTAGYVYGAEDVDLCLKLRPHGAILVQGDAAFFHNESATQRAEVSDIVRINRTNNWQRFAERWGPTLTRSILKDRILGTGVWTGRATRVVAITVTKDDPTAGYGDYFTAHELGDAMQAAGWEVRYVQRFEDDWYDLDHDIDVVIALLDAFDVSQVPPGVYTIAWVRNWVGRWIERPWFELYDLCVCSSDKAAREVAARSRFDPPVIPLATNPARFSPGPPNPTFVSDYAFTGSNWGGGREIVPLLDVRPTETFLLFGANWENEPRVRRYWRGLLDYDLLPDLYRSTKIVLDDTAGHTIEHGFVNSRVFDALASGALVVTNNQIGSDELFDGLLPVYTDRASLRKTLDRYLTDNAQRQDLVQRLQSMVLDRHTYGRRSDQFVDAALDAIERPRVAIKVGAPKAETAHTWGDYHFAHALVRSFATLGWRGEVHLLPEWDDPDRQDVDVVLHLRGLTTYAPKPSHLNVMWLISHPDDVSAEECDKYDLVCVASRPLADRLREEIRTPVVFLPQATDAARFGAATPRAELAAELLFVGNSRKQRRHSVDWAIAAGAPLTIYGSDWEEFIPPAYVKDTYFPNEELGDLYASAKIVLNDHWPDMRSAGIVSNRILDALASGAFVISDEVVGLDEIVGEAVPTFDSEQDLTELVERYLEDVEERHRLARLGQEIVLEQHTFDHRAERFVELIGPLLSGRPADCDGRVF